MTKQETLKILAIITAAYPAFQKDRDPQVTAELWNKAFEDESFEAVQAGLIMFINTDTKGFPPTIGMIKERMYSAAGTNELSEVEAWGLVVKACSNSLYNSKEEFAKLPPVIQEVIGSPAVLREWSMCDTDEFQSVIGSNFMRSYRVRAAHFKERAMLPSSIQALLPELRNSIGHPEFFAIPAPKEDPEGFLAEPQEVQGTPMPDFFRQAWADAQKNLENRMNSMQEVS